MVMRAALAILLGSAVIGAGCGDEADQTETTPPDDGPLVTYDRSGGLAYSAQRLVVEGDGAASLVVEGYERVKPTELELSQAELDELRAALEEATLESDPGPVTCSDCYSYSIEYGGEQASFDQTAIPPATEPAIGLLEQIVARESPADEVD